VAILGATQERFPLSDRRFSTRSFIAFFLAIGAAAGCNGGGDDTGGEPATTVVLTDENNYSYTAELTLASTDLQSRSDATVDWSAIDTDYRGRPLDPTDVDRLTLASINANADELIDKINNNELIQSDVDNFREYFNESGGTSAQFSEFTVLGDQFVPANEFVEDASVSWLLTLWKLNELDVYEILSSQIVVPTDASATTLVTFDNNSAILDFDADLSTAPVVTTVAGTPPYALNWATLSEDVHGTEFDDLYADTLRISHLDVPDVAAAEEVFLQLDIAADEMYVAESYGVRSIPDLSVAESFDGEPFPGFTADGIWILTFECTDLSCFSPAPMFVAVVVAE
jgi:hypothetical protein